MAPDSPPSTAELMTIGAFSRATRLSLKALRLYGNLGLLTPAWVDADSGYRYYRQDQVAGARLVARLRMLYMPLEVIARVLEQDGAEAARLLHAWWRAEEGKTAARRRLATSLGQILKGELTVKHEVALRHVPEQILLTLERRVLADVLPATIEELGRELHSHAAANGIQVTGPMMVIYHDEVNMDSDGPVEVCVPVGGAVQPFGDARVRLEPAHTIAYARITKREVRFPEILEAYKSVEAWIKENDRQVTRAPREIYLGDWSSLQDGDEACDIAFPIA